MCMANGNPPLMLPMDIRADFVYSYHKIGKQEEVAGEKIKGICLAKNEGEGIILVVRTDKDRTVTVDTPVVTDSQGNRLTAKEVDTLIYVHIRMGKGGICPDVVMPLKDGKVDLKAGENNLIYILFETKQDTVAGEYQGCVRLTGDGEMAEIPLTVKVWNFVLPVRPTCRTAFGVNIDHLCRKYGIDYGTAESDALLMQTNAMLLDFKISTFTLPFDNLSPKFDEYMKDERITSFRISHNRDEAKMKAVMEKINGNPEWQDKGYFYLVDEPHDEEGFQEVKTETDYIRRFTDGPIHQVVPVSIDSVEKSMKSGTMHGSCTIWCPISPTFKSDYVADFLESRRQMGEHIWWYCCRGIDDPNCNVYQINAPGLNIRSYFWQMYDYRVEGQLYWTICYWSFEPDDEDEWSTHIMSDEVGDGSLIYATQDHVYSSLRLHLARDGIEDYEYLVMAEKLFGRDKVDYLVDSITTSVSHYNQDNEVFREIREKLGNAIEAKTL